MVFRLFGPLRLMLCVAGLLLIRALQVTAADPPAANAPDSAATGAPTLAASQEAIEMRYRRFEGTLQQLSEYLRKTDPGRAELLVRAIGKSKEGRIPEQLQHLTDLLKKDQLGDAVERQELVVTELQSLLELLMSEAHKDDLDREKRRIQELIKDVNKLISKETDARAETERGGNNTELQNQQKQVADSTQKLVQKIESQDAAKKKGKNDESSDSSGKSSKSNDKNAKPDGQKSGEPKPGDTENPESKEGKPDHQKPDQPDVDGKTPKPGEKPGDKDGDKNGEKKPDDANPKPGESAKPGESPSGKPKSSKTQDGKSQKGKPKPGKPQEGQPQDQPQPEEKDQPEPQDSPQDDEGNPQKKQPDKTAGREEIERAKQEMDRAIEELKKNNKKNASDKQDKAIAELMKAKEKLEEILRQLREEERELVLAQMESRFRDMLLKQEAVYNGTLTIHAVATDKRTDRHRNRAVELARSEDEISLLAAKALTLLKEEGSSIAFPEAVEQIREDMLTIARRLERVDVGEITQNIEQDTIESLKELIEALQKELEKMKDKKQQQQQQQQQEQQKQPQGLVNQLAEMKMLRSLQYRVNRRTKQLGRLVDGEQAVDQDVLGQLKQLSDRQAKVQKATYDLSTGKNQ